MSRYQLGIVVGLLALGSVGGTLCVCRSSNSQSPLLPTSSTTPALVDAGLNAKLPPSRPKAPNGHSTVDQIPVYERSGDGGDLWVLVSPPTVDTVQDAMPPAFFPPNTFEQSTARLASDWYSANLVAMNEPSLLEASRRGVSVYRFLWLRTFDAPIAVRITLETPRAHLVAVRLSGLGGYEPGDVVARRERELSMAEWDGVEAALARANFDTIATHAEDIGFDGSMWILERSKDQNYRLVERWSPSHRAADAPFRGACKLLLDLAGRDFVVGDVY